MSLAARRVFDSFYQSDKSIFKMLKYFIKGQTLLSLSKSHDFAGAYPANLYGLARVLQFVSGEVGAIPGSISTTSASAHIYDHDWDWVQEMLLETPRSEG